MEFCLYEPWMHDQVINLFVTQYNVTFNDFAKKFKDFYFHPFQRDKAIMLVALEGKEVAGFQSFFYWPMCLDSKEFNVYQSGNSIVNPKYRGQRLFNRLLEQITIAENQYPTIDFLMGFPVEASFKSFIRDGWSNPFNLDWFVKMVNPIGGLFSINTEIKPNSVKKPFEPSANTIQTHEKEDFRAWRLNFSEPKLFFQSKRVDILLEYKISKRSLFINELVIGNFYGNLNHLDQAIKEISKMALRKFNITMLSFAISSDNQGAIGKLKSSGFKKINKSIHFIYKPIGFDPSTLNKPWLLTRGDIDTW